jgi:ABC-type nitrate/sulfonate/bicarbonate transport system substrate-binding protein
MKENRCPKQSLPGIRLLAGDCLCLAFALPVWGQNLERTRLGISDMSFTFLPHLLAKDAGIFRKHGLEVELIYVGGPVSISAMAAGELDYNAAPDPGLLTAAKGVPTKAVMFTTKSPPMYIVSQPGIKRMEQLAGKKLGISRIGSSTYYVARQMLQKGGVDPDKIAYIQVGSNTTRVSALTNGSLDASMLSLPTAPLLAQKGFNQLASPRDIGQRPHGGLMVRSAKLEQDREQVRKMITALVDAMEYIAKDKTKVVEYVNAKWNLSRDFAEQILVNDFLPMLTMDGRMTTEAVQEYLDSAYQHNLIPNRTRASQVLDLTVLEDIHAKRWNDGSKVR